MPFWISRIEKRMYSAWFARCSRMRRNQWQARKLRLFRQLKGAWRLKFQISNSKFQTNLNFQIIKHNKRLAQATVVSEHLLFDNLKLFGAWSLEFGSLPVDGQEACERGSIVSGQ